MKRGPALLCLAALLLSCSPAAKAGKKAPAASGGGASGGPEAVAPPRPAPTPLKPSGAGAPGSLPAAPPPAPAPAPQAGDHHLVFQSLPLALGSGHHFGPASAGSPIAPEDFEIGALADSRPKALNEAGALAAASSFLDGVVKGSYREDLALPGRKPLLALLSSPLFKDPRPASYRIGRLKIRGDAEAGEEVAACRLRFGGPAQKTGKEAASGPPSPAAIQTGEIGLRLEDKTWYVESITLDEVKAGDGSTFVPGLDEEE